MPDVTMSYQTADGSTFSATGFIHFESRETQDYKASLELHPRNDWATLGSTSSQDTTGTMKKLAINGITYDVLSDTNFSESPSKFKNEPVPTSGRTMRKMTRQTPSVKSVTIACNQSERTRLKALAETA